MQKKQQGQRHLTNTICGGSPPLEGPLGMRLQGSKVLGPKPRKSCGRGTCLAYTLQPYFFLCLLIKEGQFSHVAPQSVTWSWFLVPNCGAWLLTPESWCEIEKKNRSAKFHSYVLTFPRILPQNTYNSTIYLKTRPLNALNENAEVYTDVKLQDFTKVPWRKLNVQWRWSHFLALNARIV